MKRYSTILSTNPMLKMTNTCLSCMHTVLVVKKLHYNDHLIKLDLKACITHNDTWNLVKTIGSFSPNNVFGNMKAFCSNTFLFWTCLLKSNLRECDMQGNLILIWTNIASGWNLKGKGEHWYLIWCNLKNILFTTFLHSNMQCQPYEKV